MHTPQNATESMERVQRLAALLQQEVALLRTMVDAGQAQTPQGASPLHPPVAKVSEATPPSSPVQSASVPPPVSSAAPVDEAVAPVPTVMPSTRRFDALRSSEFWLNKVGIGLLLLGVAFLFKYSVDQGWLTPAIRCVIGLLLGGGLLGLGLRMPVQRREFGHVLLGGSIATFYITGFAAFQWYSLISYPLVLVFMSGVTGLAFALAVRRDAVALAVIGALGGLGTPFVLNTGTGSVGGLMTYLSVLLLGIGAIYLHRGWRSLWATAFVGGWTVIAVSVGTLNIFGRAALRDQWALQVAILVAALVVWAVPVVRELLRARDGQRWAQPASSVLHRILPAFPAERAPLHVLLSMVLTPFIALGMTQWVWHLRDQQWGVLFLLVATVYSVVCLFSYGRVADAWLAHGHALVSALLVLTGTVLLFHGDVLLVTLAAQALVLLVLGRRWHYVGLSGLGHALWSILGAWLFVLLGDGARGTALVNGAALSQFTVILLAGGASFVLQRRNEAWAYRVAAYVALLAWFSRELAVLPNGNGYVSVAWGALGIVVLVAGLRRDIPVLRWLGTGTLVLVVGKLFLVDLQAVEAIWRILLFIGFGAVFLVLSYFLQSVWRPHQADSAEQEEQGAAV